MDVTDTDTGIVSNEAMVFPSAPSPTELATAIDRATARVAAAAAPPPPEYSIINDDGTVTLV